MIGVGRRSVREYVQRDLDAVARLYSRYGYGPVHSGIELTGDGLAAVLAERGVERFLVAEVGGQIVGTLGLLRVSGQRVSPPGQVFAGLFFLHPEHRGGLLAGQLFAKAMAWLVDTGMDGLRVEVNPSNRQALPMYRRAGLRDVTGLGPDEDGYVELVSYLPGLVRRLRSEAPELDWDGLLGGASWRGIIRRPLVTTAGVTGRGDVEDIEGRSVLRYDLAGGGVVARALVDAATGAPLELRMTREQTLPPLSLPPAPASAITAQPCAVHRDGKIQLDLDSATGSLWIHHDDHRGPVLHDPWPVVGPPFLTGWRRPLPRQLEVSAVRGGFRVRELIRNGALIRESIVDKDRLRQTLYLEGGGSAEELFIAPWVLMRESIIIGEQDGERWHLPAVRGVCPIDVVDFEALGLRNLDARVVADSARHGPTWWDPNTGVSITMRWYMDASPRYSGGFAPALSTKLTAESFDYEIKIDRMLDAGTTVPLAVPYPLVRHKTDASTPPTATPTVEGRWQSRRMAGRETFHQILCNQALFVDAAAGGVVSWNIDRVPVLATPFPKTRPFGAKPNWAAGLWLDAQGCRESPESGIGWGVATYPWEYSEARSTTDATAESHSDSDRHAEGPTLTASGLRMSAMLLPTEQRREPNTLLGRMRVVAAATSQAGAGELVIHLTPDSRAVRRILIPGRRGEVWEVLASGNWRCWAPAVAAALTDGRWLTCWPVSGDGAEVLVRMTAGGPLLSLTGRRPAGRPASMAWDLIVGTRPPYAWIASARQHDPDCADVTSSSLSTKESTQ